MKYMPGHPGAPPPGESRPACFSVFPLFPDVPLATSTFDLHLCPSSLLLLPSSQSSTNITTLRCRPIHQICYQLRRSQNCSPPPNFVFFLGSCHAITLGSYYALDRSLRHVAPIRVVAPTSLFENTYTRSQLRIASLTPRNKKISVARHAIFRLSHCPLHHDYRYE